MDIEKKYTEELNFTFESIDGREYICRAKRCVKLSKILDMIQKDFKEIFLSKLKRRVVSSSKDAGASGSGIAVAPLKEGNVKASKQAAKQPHHQKLERNNISLGKLKRMVKKTVKRVVIADQKQITFENHIFFKKRYRW